jgi:hypothetical protein
MTVAFVLIVVEVLVPAARRLLTQWMRCGDRRWRKRLKGFGHPPKDE